jgi:Asp-tRNA(Asn)/Glu-tRNA(Gln) amidotransferase A subunit family amidase
MDDVELCYLSASQMGECVRRRQLSPIEIVRAVLERIERLDPLLNAFVTWTPGRGAGRRPGGGSGRHAGPSPSGRCTGCRSP